MGHEKVAIIRRWPSYSVATMDRFHCTCVYMYSKRWLAHNNDWVGVIHMYISGFHLGWGIMCISSAYASPSLYVHTCTMYFPKWQIISEGEGVWHCNHHTFTSLTYAACLPPSFVPTLQALYHAFGGSQKGLSIKGVVCGLALLAHSSVDEKAKCRPLHHPSFLFLVSF